jgi:hypothetical protein
MITRELARPKATPVASDLDLKKKVADILPKAPDAPAEAAAE